ncbi:MAG TPA: CopD family protein [Bacteroidia bacterium]|nr:CopD family protein [Bacteroidia bacterium]
MLYLKALHIIFIVTWFAGLFYIVRLFIYHTEAQEKPEPEKSILQKQFKLMEKRLWFGITWPSMILTWIFGLWLAFTMYGFNVFNFPAWLTIKLGFVLGLTIYHLTCGIVFNRLKNDKIKLSSSALRIWNEVATLFLVAIVFLVVLKSFFDLFWGLAGFIVFSLLLFLAIAMYKKNRIKNQ